MFFNCIKLTAKCLQRANQSNLYCITPVIRMQKYSDWYHRRPTRIVNEEEILQHIEEAEGPNEYIGENVPRDRMDVEKRIPRNRMDVEKRIPRNRMDVEEEIPRDGVEAKERKPLKVRPKPKAKLMKKKFNVTPNDSRLREDGSLNVIELKETDPTLTTLMMSVRSKKTRDRNCRVILEGRRLIEDAINSGAIPEIIVFSRITDAEKLPLPDKGVRLYKVPYRSIQMWSTLVTSPGLMGFFKIPDVERKKPTPDALPLTIICDNVRDPGNLGSILRAAAAVGCKKLITLDGCVDIWEPKVLKTAAGCHFRMPIFASKTWQEIPQLIDPYANIYVADNNAFNEAEHQEKADESTETEENVAENQLEAESNTETDENVEEDDESVEDIDETTDQKRKTNYQRIMESKIAKQLTSRIPVIPYYGTNYTDNENIIIIGGETLGLSMEALDMVNEKYGVRINIPMTNGVESLNTGMALGIIAFEMKRQHAIVQKPTET